MSAIYALLIETIALLGAIGLTFLTILAFRSPNRPIWMRIQAVQTTAAIALLAVFGNAVAFQVTGLTSAGLTPLMAVALTTILCLVTICAIWRLFEISERLRLADAGASPFYRIGELPVVNPATPQLGS